MSNQWAGCLSWQNATASYATHSIVLLHTTLIVVSSASPQHAIGMWTGCICTRAQSTGRQLSAPFNITYMQRAVDARHCRAGRAALFKKGVYIRWIQWMAPTQNTHAEKRDICTSCKCVLARLHLEVLQKGMWHAHACRGTPS